MLLPPRRPRVMTAHHVLPRAPEPPGRSPGARRVFARMDAVVAHSEHGAERLRAEVGLDPSRVRTIHHGAFDYLTRLPEESPLPAELEGAEGPGDPLLRPAPPLQGARRPARGLPAARGRRAVGRRQPAHGPRAAAPRRGAPLRAGCASSSASSPRRRSRRSSGAPTSSSFPTWKPSTRACSTPASRFGKPMVLSAVGGFPEVAAAGRRAPRPARGRRGAGDDAGGAARRPAPRGSGSPPPRRPRRPVPTPGTSAARRTLELYEELLEGRR